MPPLLFLCHLSVEGSSNAGDLSLQPIIYHERPMDCYKASGRWPKPLLKRAKELLSRGIHSRRSTTVNITPELQHAIRGNPGTEIYDIDWHRPGNARSVGAPVLISSVIFYGIRQARLQPTREQR